MVLTTFSLHSPSFSYPELRYLSFRSCFPLPKHREILKRCMTAGESSGNITELLPAAQIVETMMAEAIQTIESRLQSQLRSPSLFKEQSLLATYDRPKQSGVVRKQFMISRFASTPLKEQFIQPHSLEENFDDPSDTANHLYLLRH
jgi:hypothetical protein